MEAEFDRAERRREKERKEAARARKLKEEQEARARRIVEEAERKRQEIRDQQLEKDRNRRQREEEEALMSGGINFSKFYRPVPMASLETDKIKLPPSALEALSSAGAIESGRILAFELSLFDDATEKVVSKTNCGVSEFTAEEGTVQVPVKAAMSLTRHLGEAALTKFKVRIRYVSIDRFDKVRARVQPLGSGFHLNGANEVSLDLKALLERALSKQTIISEGDWIPLRHDGRTYTLSVRELWPDSQCVLLNTDVEIDIMPSEDAEREILKQQEKERLKNERIQRAKVLAQTLPAEPAQGVTIRARFPESLTGTRRFEQDAKLEVVFNWAESVLGDLEPPKNSRGLEIELSFLPRQSKVFLQTPDLMIKSLRECGFGRQENLNFRWHIDENAMDVVQEEEEKQGERKSDSAGSEEWSATKAVAESTLDRHLATAAEVSPEPTSTSIEEESTKAEISSADMFRLLVSKGAESVSAAKACQRYLPALRSLFSLNLLDSEGAGVKAVELAEKFKGSSERIADAMMAYVSEQETKTILTKTVVDQWGEQIEILQSMFTGKDRSEIVNALEKHGGSVQHAVNELLS